MILLFTVNFSVSTPSRLGLPLETSLQSVVKFEQVEVQKLAKRMDMVWGKAISQKNAASEEEIFHPNRGSVFATVYEKLDEKNVENEKIDHLNYEGNSTWKMDMMEFERI